MHPGSSLRSERQRVAPPHPITAAALTPRRFSDTPAERRLQPPRHETRPGSTRYGYNRCNCRGNAIASRMCGMPLIHATVRSTPRPKPECTKLPYFRRSRYQR